MSELSKLLIVDDSADAREFCEMIARMLDINVRQANSVDRALNLLGRGYVPDMIVLDLMMPGKSPEELVEFLRADANLKNVRVILVSALREVAARAREMGADDCIRKPFDIARLVSSFRKIAVFPPPPPLPAAVSASHSFPAVC